MRESENLVKDGVLLDVLDPTRLEGVGSGLLPMSRRNDKGDKSWAERVNGRRIRDSEEGEQKRGTEGTRDPRP